jgi:formylglycine-generating enzyme required for sulfatase activity
MRTVPRDVLLLLLSLSLSRWVCSQTRDVPAQAKTRINPKDELTYVWIPPGTFQMGCSPGDSKCSEYEKTPHSVTITKGFWIGRTPVTQAAYKKVMGVSHSHFKGEQLPEDSVTWYEAKVYCEHVDMRLPTEAQWEYAARGGNPASRYGPAAQIAWYRVNSGGRTHGVALKKPNDYGLYDMLGDVDEWSADPFWPHLVDLNEEGLGPSALTRLGFDMPPPSLDNKGESAPRPWEPPKSISRTVRGASWDNDSYLVSVSNRMRYDPENRHPNVGFRCVAN